MGFTVCTSKRSYREGFAESLQQECSKLAQNVMIELYFCGNKEGSWVVGLQGSVAKILQNPVLSLSYYILLLVQIWGPSLKNQL